MGVTVTTTTVVVVEALAENKTQVPQSFSVVVFRVSLTPLHTR